MGLYDYGCTDPSCGSCQRNGFNPGAGWLASGSRFAAPPLKVKKRKKAKKKKSRAKAAQ